MAILTARPVVSQYALYLRCIMLGFIEATIAMAQNAAMLVALIWLWKLVRLVSRRVLAWVGLD